jgi:Fur family peroxide stress response transcriptional regulator
MFAVLTNNNSYRLITNVTTADAIRFRELCVQHGLTATHQRQILFEVLQGMTGHPSPEEVYERVKRRIPSISLATVYKNIHVFIESGMFREVSLHHGSLRIEVNSRPHQHLVCTVCRSISDIDEKDLGLSPKPKRLSGGFLVERYAVDVLGRCPSCQEKS